MKVTNFGPGGFPLSLAGWSTGVLSVNSNFNTEDGGLNALNFVQRITANTSNTLLNPIVNFASGSNILLTLDAGPLNSIPSNTIRIHSTGGSGGNIITSNGSNSLAAIVNLKAGSGIALGVSGQDVTITNTGSGGGGGGTSGITQSYIGYNTIGGTAEAATQGRNIAKQVTLASAGFVASIGAYIKMLSADDAYSISVAVWTDNANTVGNIIAVGVQPTGGAVWTQVSAGARWVDYPLGAWLAAGTYWIGIDTVYPASGSRLNLHYDGGGSDRRFDASPAFITDGGIFTQTDTTRKYSIRATLLV